MKNLFINKLAIILLLLFNIANSEVIHRPNILFLHSYHPSSVWTKEVNKGMNSIFNDTNKFNIYIEFMDTKRYRTKKHFDNLKNIYNEKYKNIKFDVIISSDDNAFNFLKEYNQTIFKDSPVVFCGVNNLQKKDLVGFDNFTGVTEKNNIEKNFDLIIKLHPKTKTIYNLVDTTTTGDAVKELIIKAINNSKYKDIKFEFIDDFTMEQLIEKFKSLPNNSVLLHSAFFKTKDNQYIEYSDLKSLLNEHVTIPVYTSADQIVGNSVIGGFVISGYSQGTTAASMAKRILEGVSTKNIPVLYDSPNEYIFDYKQIKKFEIEESLLPINSNFINKSLSAFEIYFREIITTIIIFLLMSIYIITLLINIKKRKELELKNQKSNNFINKFIEDANAIVSIINNEGRMVKLNKFGREFSGYSEEEISKEPYYWLVLLPDSIKNKIKDLVDSAKLDKLPKIYENDWISKNGELKTFQWSNTVIKKDDNSLDFIVSVGIDITYKNILIEQSKLASMGQMIGNIAHQWRQPLNVITTEVSGLKLKIEFNEKISNDKLIECADDVMLQANYLSKTIDSFRNFIKGDNFKIEISIVDIINKSISIINASLNNNYINLITKMNDDIKILGNSSELIQVFINILNNSKDAIKELKLNDEDKFIFIETQKIDKNHLKVTIKDNGGGIKEDIINRIFEPYFTTKHESLGTGLGLSMSYQILVERHNTTITAYNEEYNYFNKKYKGACFEIIFKAD